MFTLMVFLPDRVVFLPVDRNQAVKYNLKNGQLSPFNRYPVRIW